MRSVLEGISNTPLVLKGGTALMLAYGLDRFSEDLDFDAPHKINLESRIRHSVPFGVSIDGIDTLKDTPTVTRYRVRYRSNVGQRSLKLEISYRAPTESSDVRYFGGLCVSSLPRLIDQKLKAAHDGAAPRSKVRDLYDLDFAARHWPVAFVGRLGLRLRTYTADPDALVSRYLADYREDDLVQNLVELDRLTIRLHCAAEEMVVSAKEVDRRVAGFCRLESSARGPTAILWKHAAEALRCAYASGVGIREINWRKAETDAISEAILECGWSPVRVADDLCKCSPGAVMPMRQDEIRVEAAQLGVQAGFSPAVDSESEQDGDLPRPF